MPAGKLEVYHVVPSEEEAKPHRDSQHQTPEPISAPVPSVPAVTQVSLEEGWGPSGRGVILSGRVTTLWRGQGQGSVAIPVSWPGMYLEKADSCACHVKSRELVLYSIVSTASGIISFIHLVMH